MHVDKRDVAATFIDDAAKCQRKCHRYYAYAHKMMTGDI